MAIEDRQAMVVSADQMGVIVDLTPRRLAQLAAEGMPKAGRNGYPLVATVRWVIEYWRKRAVQSPLSEGRRRKIEADAGAAELDLALKRGKLADIESLAYAHGRSCARLRTRLLAIPSKLAPQAHRTKTIAEIEAMIRREITEALEELSGVTPTKH